MKIAMILIFFFGFDARAAEPVKGNQLEFDESVVEGIGGTFSGVTAVRTKHESSNLYSRQVDFKEKIRESLKELPYQAIPGQSGAPK